MRLDWQRWPEFLRMSSLMLTNQENYEDAVQNLETLIYFQSNVSRAMSKLEFTVMYE
jgi:hypothetical protein